MIDFTLKVYRTLLQSLLDAGFCFISFEKYLEEKPSGKIIIIRHDVDKNPYNSLKTATIENQFNIRGSYYFRILPKSNQPFVIKEIRQLGHEIGYHYEDLSLCGGDYNEAIKSFTKNLDYFRQYYPVKTICMHGSPLSKYDNRLLWNSYHYSDYGILGEPYFDIEFSEFLYLTDTGRCWNGDNVSIRDKPTSSKSTINKLYSTFKSSFDIIDAAKNQMLPDKVMLTIHPQRWTDNYTMWTKELIAQNFKNVIKQYLVNSA